MNMGVLICLQDPDFNYFGYIHRRKTAESYGSLIFNFLRSLHLVFKQPPVAVPFYIPINRTQGPNLSTLSSTLAIFGELDSSQSNGCEGLFLCRRRSLLNSQHDRNWEAMEVTM